MSPLLLLCAPSFAAGLQPAAAGLHHDLSATLDPAAHRIDITDRLDLRTATPDEQGGYRFLLHAGLDPVVSTGGWVLERVPGEVSGNFFGINATTDSVPENVQLEGWRLVPRRAGKAKKPVEVRYGGVIHHEVTQAPEEYQRSFAETPGIIDDQGVFLSGTSFWVPSFGDDLFTFDLQVAGLTAPWDVVSQGARVRHSTSDDGSRITSWKADFFVDEIYLVAGPWHEYLDSAPRRAGGRVETIAFLREDDPGLAGKYLQATRRYLALYEGMLPPYPFASFSLVENWWDTGYGMPGFTLLGPQVIRFPWVLTSSYPHELLHNWWGNSAYVDPAQGNWCEGLTAYMADHLFAEDRSEGAAYRRATLQKYSDFVGAEQDFPLSEFGSRSSAASEAVGYGKALMMYHMLRRQVSDDVFRAALFDFYDKQQYQRATFADIADSLSDVSGVNWRPFVSAWTTRTGAPVLEIVSSTVDQATGGWTVSVSLQQAQGGEPYPMVVPVLVTHDGGPPVEAFVDLSTGEATAEISVSGRPLRLDVDPAFDTMRRLDPLELPPAVSTLMGAEKHTFVLPSASSPDEKEAWKALAIHWAKPAEPLLLVDDAITALPEGNVWVLGWKNRFAPVVAGSLAADQVSFNAKTLTVGATTIAAVDGSAVLVARSAADPAAAVGWVGASTPAAIPGLSRKLPHYTRYSYLGFKGDAPDNTLKGSWEPRTSPLVANLAPGEPLAALKLPERSPLAALPSLFDGELMGRDVRMLASSEWGGRGLGSPGLSTAGRWLEGRLAEAGLVPAGDDGFQQNFTWTAPPGEGAPQGELSLTNVLGRIPGTDPSLAPVVVMAHYDHLGSGWPDAREGNGGKSHPGADDNASGVAVALDLARVMAAEGPKPRSVVFAFTTGEEAGLLGARHLLQSMPADGLPFACVNLDTVGRLGDGPLLVIDAGSASEWRHVFMGTSYTTGVRTSIVEEPLDSSDQGACLERGVPAVQLFSGPNEDYHRPTDTADKVDLAGMVDVADVVHEAVGYLAERLDPLTVQIGGVSQGDPPTKAATERKVSLGTMPDFTFAGPGVRVDKVMPGTPAEAAGIRAGDVVVAIDGRKLAGLKDYSDVLKAHQAGDVIVITLLRGGEQTEVSAKLVTR